MDELYSRPEAYEALYADYDDDIRYIIEWVRASLGLQKSPADSRSSAHFGQAPLRRGVIELACGAGRIAGPLASELPETWQVTGVDISSPMIELARRRWPEKSSGGRSGSGTGAALCWLEADILDPAAMAPLYASADALILAANSLAHFTYPALRRRLYRMQSALLAPGGRGFCAVLTSDSFADSEAGLIEVGRSDPADAGDAWDVYEESRAAGHVQLVNWYFVSDSGEADFENRFELCRFSPGQLAQELEQAGFAVQSLPGGSGRFASRDGDFWEILVYTQR
jgi:SAM-dependent methyltransferase